MAFDVKEGLQNLMKEAQRMQKEMESAQKNIAKQLFVGQFGAGAVKVSMTGNHDTMKVEIDRTFFTDKTQEEIFKMLEELFAAANNDTNMKIMQTSKQHINLVTEKLGIKDFQVPEESDKDDEE